ncbi:hypothetical protein BUALT_Bualt13G0034800 [Buddleja alternifolia]|uniref:Transposase n=1 Tax=Buddleja alternifolia TaxID=168488 RepID=A0AAV6WK54_9LAMI|nr:hypothetical protein BUALT_Bualt13G0034800 [Buddleja alternifolia]
MSATRGGKSKRPFVVPSHEVDQGHVSFMSMMTAKMNHLSDLELGLNNDVDGEQELVDNVAEDVDKEERHTSEHTFEQHVEANLGIKEKIERDDKGHEILVIQEKCFISVAAPRSMLGDMRGWFTKPWPTFNKIPEDVKRNLFGKFKAAQNDGKPVPHELVFNRCHKRNKGLGPFVDEKSKRTSETYTKLKKSHSQSCGDAVLSPQGSSTFIPEAWAKASGGAKNGRCYGFGKSYSDSFTFSSTIPSNNSSQAEVDQLKERMQELEKEQQEIKANVSELLALTRATHANLSGQHFFSGQYSSPQYSPASPDEQNDITNEEPVDEVPPIQTDDLVPPPEVMVRRSTRQTRPSTIYNPDEYVMLTDGG